MSITDVDVPPLAFAPPPVEPTPEPSLPQPFVERSSRVGNLSPQDPFVAEPEQTFFEKLRDSFEIDNDVVAAYQIMTREQFAPKPGYDLAAHLEQTYPDLLLNNRDAFGISGSPEETDAIAARIRNEQAIRSRQASGGFGGFVAGAVAGTATPLSLMPYVRFAKLGREAVTAAAARRYGGGALEGAVNVGAATLAQEAVLQTAQETRDQWETVANVGAGMVLGSVLGAGIRFFSPVEVEQMRDLTRAVLEDAPLPPQRAEQYGPATRTFAGQFPITGYHGTGANFEKFAADKLGAVTGAESAEMGFFFSKSPETANTYAALGRVPRPDNFTPEETAALEVLRRREIAAERAGDNAAYQQVFDERLAIYEGINYRLAGGGPNVRPTRLRMDNPFVYDFAGNDYREITFADLMRQAQEAGHDGVILKNTRDGGPVDDIYAVFSADQIRSAYDPIFFSEWALKQYDEPIGPSQYAAAMADARRTAEIMAADARGEIPGRAVGAEAAKPAKQSAGIMVARPSDANRIATKVAGAVLRTGARLGPVTRGLASANAAMRTTVAKLSDTGLTLQENAFVLNEKGEPEQYTVAPGGTAENRSKSWYGNLARTISFMDEKYLEYKTVQNKGLFANVTQRMKDVARDRERRKAGLGPRDAVFDPTVTWARVALRDAAGNPVPLTWTAMMEEADKAARYDPAVHGEHPIPQVREIAEFYRKTIEEPVLQAAEDAGLFEGLQLDKDGIRHVLREWNKEEIGLNRGDWIWLLKRSWERPHQENFANELMKFREQQRRADEDAADVLTTPDQYEAKVSELTRALEDHAKSRPLFTDVEVGIKSWQKIIRDAEAKMKEKGLTVGPQIEEKIVANAKARLEGLKARQKDLKAQFGDQYTDWIAERNRLRQRLTRVRSSAGGLELKAERAIGEAEELESANIDAMQAIMQKGADFAARADALDDAEFDAAISALRNQFADVAAKYDAAEEAAFAVDGPAQQARAEKLTRIAERLERLESFDRAGAMAEIQNAIEAVAVRVETQNFRRTLRANKLREDAATKYDPKRARDMAKRTRERKQAREDAFVRKWEEIAQAAPGTAVDLEAGTLNLSDASGEVAEAITQKILGSEITINPLTDMLADARGAELARTLRFLDDREAERFINHDLDRLAKTYIRQIAPDIEIKKVFGSLTLNEQQAAITAEWERLRAAETDPEKIRKLYAAEEQEAKDLQTVVDRLRNRRGVPDDPSSWTYRLGSTAMLLNYTRLLGLQVLGSVADLGKPVFHMGFSRAYGDIIEPHVRALQDPAMARFVERAKDELFSVGIGTDMTLDMHSLIQADMVQDLVQRKSFAGKALEHASGRFGLVSMMAPWNKVVRNSVGMAVITRQMRAIEATVAGKASAEQTEELLRAGIDDYYAKLIWRLMTETPDGGEQFANGIWLPNSEKWTGREGSDARRALAAAVQREVNIINVQGTLNKPRWADEHIGLRLMFQFRNFGWESMTRTIGAGLQARNAATLQGAASMIGLGIFSYAIRSYLAGGETAREFREMPWPAVVAKGIDQSGLLASINDVTRIAEATALGGPANWLGAERRFPPDYVGLMSAVLGPGFDLGTRSAKIGSDVFEEAAQQMGADVSGGINGYTVHNFRMLWAFQNTQPFAHGFDAVEKGAVKLFGLDPRRDQ
jgi:hypothetical protein